jgi:hypothetical protein
MMNQSKSTNKPHFSYLPYLVFFLASFLFFAFFGDYVCFFQEKSSLFIFSYDYLNENLHQPGSIIIYLGKFLSTFYFYPVAGAIIISLIICLIVYLITKILSYLSGDESVFVPLLFGVAVFFLQTNYQFLLYNSLGILLQLTFFYLTIKHLKGWLPVFIFPFWYFVTGGFAWIFCLMFTFYLVSKSWRIGWSKIISLWFLNLLIIYISKEFIFFQTTRTLIFYPFSNSDTGSQFKLFLPVVALLVLLPIIAGIKIRLFPHKKDPNLFYKIIPSLILVILVVTTASLRFDKKAKQYFHVEKLFYQNRLEEIIEYNSKNPSTNILTSFLNNIALCETGRLNDQLFYFPQSPDGQTLFLKWEMIGEVLRRGGYFYYTIGMINEAHRWAFENMVMKGISPEGLKMLIKTELIYGNYKMAAKYIPILKKTIFYRSEASGFEKLLFDDKAVESNPELGEKRKSRITRDFFAITDDPYINIERVLATDSLNRKAFEYKLAYLLLKKNNVSIAAELSKLERYGFKKIPVHLEEAAAAYKILNSGPLSDFGNLQIDAHTELRFNQFLQTFQSYGNDLKAAEPVLKQKFGNTFWYWAFYK